jgi:cell wall-associated NlpC family hydrolase
MNVSFFGAALVVALAVTSCAGNSVEQRCKAAVDARACATQARFDEVMAWARAQKLQQQSRGAVTQAVGERFLGAPYVTGPLSRANEPEQLETDLQGFDCVTLTESVLALSKGITSGDASWSGFREKVADLRYRDGRHDDLRYSDRLHYFTEWIRDNEGRGNVKDITTELDPDAAGRTVSLRLQSTTDKDALDDKPEELQRLRDVEGSLSQQPQRFITLARVESAAPRIQPGDVIALVTSIDGLDVLHVGLAVRTPQGSLGFLHAEKAGNKVMLSPSLAEYARNRNTVIGVVVARPL